MQNSKNIFQKIKDFFYSRILKRLYYREGACKGCGRCCEKIYVKHGAHVIKNEDFFYKLQKMHGFYKDLELLGKDETGLIFACKNLDKETRKCKIHKTRPSICRKYPTEEIFQMGGDIAKTCGYKFTPIFSFESVLEKIQKKF